MKPLVVLLLSFLLFAGIIWLYRTIPDWSLAARIAMSIMLFFTGYGHFTFKNGMSRMLPSKVPYKRKIIVVTGLLEFLAAIGLLTPAYQKSSAEMLILLFILFLPANIYAALHRINYGKSSRVGPGPRYLWIRIPLQIFFIAWVYFAALYRK